MAKVQILSLEQTDVAGIFTIIFENETESEFVKFIDKFKADATLADDLKLILNQIDLILQRGVAERYFRPEGKMRDNVVALPVYKSALRIYCLRLSDSVLIVGNGGRKDTKTYQENNDLNGYVISLQRLDKLLKADIQSGAVRIEKANIIGIDNKIYEL
ncbi:MAG: hypothetical protein ACI3YI_02880 [Bacteroidaceae bacterium]